MQIKKAKAAILAKSREPLIVDEIELPEALDVGQVLVKVLYTTICGAQLNEIAAEYKEKVTIAKLNIDENPKTPQRFAVRGIPTLILFKNGQVEGQKVGALRKSDLAAFLDSKL